MTDHPSYCEICGTNLEASGMRHASNCTKHGVWLLGRNIPTPRRWPPDVTTPIRTAREALEAALALVAAHIRREREEIEACGSPVLDHSACIEDKIRALLDRVEEPPRPRPPRWGEP